MLRHSSMLVAPALVLAVLLAACSSDASNLASPSTATTTCGAGNALQLVAGQITTPLSGTGLCVSGGASGAEYALVAFNGSTVPSATTSLTFQNSGLAALNSQLLTNVLVDPRVV